MAIKEIRAFILPQRIDSVKEALLKHGVKGISISKVKGCGEYVNFFRDDMMTDHTCIDIISPDDKVEEIVSIILDATSSEGTDEGIVVISPVERIFRIRTKKELSQQEIFEVRNHKSKD